MSFETNKRSLWAILFAVLVSFIAIIFTGPFVRVLRRHLGAWRFWVLAAGFFAALIGFQQYFLALTVGMTWLSLGLQLEFELRGWSFVKSSSLALILTMLVGGLGTDGLLALQGQTWQDVFVSFADLLKQIPSFKAVSSNITSEWFVSQLPSVVVISLLMEMIIGNSGEGVVAGWFGFYYQRLPTRLKLSEFRVRDSYIWVFLGSLGLVVVDLGSKFIQMFALNLVNLSVVLFFLQGLAVTVVFLRVTRAGFFTRALTVLVVLLGQGILILGILGLVDYWVDFRGRMRKQRSLRDL